MGDTMYILSLKLGEHCFDRIMGIPNWLLSFLMSEKLVLTDLYIVLLTIEQMSLWLQTSPLLDLSKEK